MTEAEWLACADPGRMLNWLTHETHRGEHSVVIAPRDVPLVSGRKLRLFACACCRQLGGRLTDERSRRAVEVAERYADGLASAAELRRANHAADVVTVRSSDDPAAWLAAWVCGDEDPLENFAVNARGVAGLISAEAHAALAALLRCVAGNPWVVVERVHARCTSREENPGPGRRLLHVHDAWLSWGGGAVPKLARHVYESRDWAALPVLADALEEAGCPAEEACPGCGGRGYVGGAEPATAATWRGHLCEACLGSGGPPGPNPLLAHLRGPGPHARGCWALDLVLGKS
jgi:hypothetical protein